MESSLSVVDWASAALLVAATNNRGNNFFMFEFLLFRVTGGSGNHARYSGKRADQQIGVNRIKIFSRCLILALPVALVLGCGGSATAHPLTLDNGWVRGMPPGVDMTAAYGRFINAGDETIEIASFESDSFASVSLHQTTIEGGTSGMKPVRTWSIEPGTAAVLAPGALHLMLMQATREIVVGSTVELSLISTSGQSYHFTLQVEAR